MLKQAREMRTGAARRGEGHTTPSSGLFPDYQYLSSETNHQLTLSMVCGNNSADRSVVVPGSMPPLTAYLCQAGPATYRYQVALQYCTVNPGPNPQGSAAHDAPTTGP